MVSYAPYDGYGWRSILVAVLLVLAPGLPLLAQFEAQTWYFGERAGLSFRTGTATPISDGVLYTGEGCATQSDRTTGALLFYTDGSTVWNRNHQVMVDGTGLNGDFSTSQSALIVPSPADPFVFYIFTPAALTSNQSATHCLCLSYSVVDLREDAGYGRVVSKNIVLVNDITEHLTATRDCRGDGYWIVVRSRSTRYFFAFHLTADTQTPVLVPSDAGNPQITVRDIGQMHISPDGRHLIITSGGGNSLLYDFDAGTGHVTDGIPLFKPANTGEQHYGAAFTADSRYVYVALTGQPSAPGSRIVRFPTNLAVGDDVETVGRTIGTVADVTTWTPMQLGPDGRIYVGRPNDRSLGVIERPMHADPDSVRFRDAAIPLSGRCMSGLPNFMGSTLFPDSARRNRCLVPTARFTIEGGCAGSCVPVVEASVDDPQQWEWSFQGGVPAVSLARNPGRICYPEPGTYTVRLVVRNAYGADTTEGNVIIRPSPTVIADSLVDVCPGASAVLRASGAQSYRWSPVVGLDDPTSATPTVTPTVTTVYSVVGDDGVGCSDSATVIVRVVTMVAGSDVTICRGGEARLTATGADTYRWAPTDDLDDSTSANPRVSPTTTTTYTVTMTHGACTTVDTVLVSVVDGFTVDAGADTTICAGTAATLRVTGGSGVVTWFPDRDLDNAASPTPVARPTTTTTYVVTVRSGDCIARDTVVVTVNDAPTVVPAPDVAICPGDTAILSVDASGATSLRWEPAALVTDPTAAVTRTSVTETTTFVATFTAANGCQAMDTVVVVVRSGLTVDAGPDKTICEGGSVQLSGVGDGPGATYTWSPTTGLNNPSILSPIASPAATTTYILKAVAGSCIAYDTMTVIVSSVKAIRITADTSICRGGSVRLVADGSASRFEWSPVTGLSNTASADPVASPQQTTRYTVRAWDPIGCMTEASVTVHVREVTPIRLTIVSTAVPAGEDSVGMAILIDVDERYLPMRIDSITGEIENDLTVFLPASVDRGLFIRGVVGGIRKSFFRLDNQMVITRPQRLTTIRGTALLGNSTTTTVSWDSAAIYGVDCPAIDAVAGTLLVTGCYIQGRLFRFHGATSVRATADPATGALDILLEGNEPGEHQVRLIAMDGSVLWATTIRRQFGDTDVVQRTTGTTALASGQYFLQHIAPSGVHTQGISIVR